VNQNSFQPIDEEKSKAFHSQEINDDQEIVTANPDEENVNVNDNNFYLSICLRTLIKKNTDK
jgi:hypothetical protein